MQRAQWLPAPRGRRRVPGGSASPGIGAGSLARAGAGERGMLPAGGGKTLFAEELERFGGEAGLLTPWLSTTPREGEERRARLSSTPAATCRSGVPPTRPWPAWLSHEARPGDPLSLSTRPPPPPCMFPHHRLPSGGRGDTPSLRGHRGGNPPTPSRCDSGSPSHAPFLSFPTAASRSRARWEPGLG